MSIISSTPNPATCLSKHLPSWGRLVQHRQQWNTTLAELFKSDENRASTFSVEFGPLFLDYSKSHLNRDTLQLLQQLCEEADLDSAIDRLLSGAPVNNTEKRPAWHTALRAGSNGTSKPPAAVNETHIKMKAFVETLLSQKRLGFNNEAITDVVNIGIGGSDLGPRMVCKALCDYHQANVKVHFVANIDGAEIHHTLQTLNPETTLFIVASKSFTTLETLENAKSARRWIMQGGCPAAGLPRHFVAISSNIEKAKAFGIAEENIFPMWDWVGGRYSLWSAIGLPIAIAVGWENFTELLNGAAEMDKHFSEAPFLENMPVILALITFWYSQLWSAQSQAILPYCHQLQRFPDFLQQLDMESLGKSVNRQGESVNYPTGIAIWGTEESNGQHSFHQLFHQGQPLIPVDFIATLKPNHKLPEQHRQLLACCLSQSQALLDGKNLNQATEELQEAGYSETEIRELAAHKVIPGNRPSNTLLIQQLTPRSLGNLIALYEHKVYVLSILLNINAFDQWGVELGKQLGTKISDALTEGSLPEQWDSSTRQLAQRILREQ